MLKGKDGLPPSMNIPATCLICRGPAIFEPEQPDAPNVHRASCQVCGRYRLSWDAGTILAEPRRQPDLALLSAYVRQASDAGRIVELDAENWEIAVSEMRAVPVSNKIRKVLRAVAEGTRVAGDWLHCDPRSDFKTVLQRQAGAANESELDFLLSALVRTGLLIADLDSVLRDGWDVVGIAIQVTPDGWASLQAEDSAVRGTCFVAMSFAPDLDTVYERAISPGIESCGLQVVRVDRVEHNDNINDRLMADLRRSEVIVADFTYHKGGVYFEAGFALGLDRTVVFTCRRDEFKEGAGVHFDTRPYNHLLWSSDALDAFKTNLAARLQNTVPSLKRGALNAFDRRR